MVIVLCPYCFQKINTKDKEKSYTLPVNLRCPNCEKIFIFGESGVDRIASELKADSINNYIKVLASHY